MALHGGIGDLGFLTILAELGKHLVQGEISLKLLYDKW